MTTKYTTQINSAQRLIAAKGRPLVLKKPLAGGIDPVTQADTRTFTDHNISAVQLPTGQPGREESNLPENLRGRRVIKLLIAAKGLAVEPLAADLIVIDGASWTVLSTTVLAPDGVPIIFTSILYL